MNRILFEPEELGSPLSAQDPRARHIRKVLGLGVGDVVRVGVVDGEAGRAQVVADDASGMRFEFLHWNDKAPDLYPVTVIAGHTRPIVLQRVLRDLSTLGVRLIIVLHTQLGEKSYFKSNLWSNDGYRDFLVEGASQAGATKLPKVQRAWTLEQAYDLIESDSATKSNTTLEPHGKVEQPSIRVVFDLESEYLQAVPDTGASSTGAAGQGFVAAFGSERGWTTQERNSLTAAGFRCYGLGERILRSETATIAGTALLLKAQGFFA